MDDATDLTRLELQELRELLAPMHPFLKLGLRQASELLTNLLEVVF